MSDIFSPFKSFFFPGDTNKNVPQELRQRLALAMLMQKRKFPTTLGEGLGAIGESIGDIGTMRRIEAEAAAAEKAGTAAENRILGGVPPAAPASPSPVQAAAISAPSSLYQPPDQDPRSQEPVPPTVQEGGPTPTTQPVFRPNLRTATPPAQALPPAAPAVPAPPDVPGATRMSTPEQLADFRAQNPLPQNIPPLPPPGGPPPGLPPRPTAPARPSVADYGQKPALAPTPTDPNASPLDNMPWPHGNAGAPPPGAPVMAQGPDPTKLPSAPPDDPRRAVALAMMRQGQTGQPPASAFAQSPAPTPPAPTPLPNQSIAAAPPAVPPITKMPQPSAGPGPDYIPPEKPAPTPPPLTTEIMQRIQQEIRAASPAERDSVQKRLAPLYQNEQAKVTQAHEIWKDEIATHRAYEQKREELKATAAQRGATYAHSVQQTNAGKIIQMEGRAFRVQDDGSLKDITPGQTGDGPPQIKMTQDQSDTLKFYKMGKTAASQLEGKEKILAEGWASELAGKIPFAGNKLMSSQYRAAKNAAGLLVQADLRDTSGATIGTQEYKDRFALLMPLSGDDSLAMRNKAEARKAVLEGQRLALGTARPMADYVDKEHAKERADKVAKLETEMSGKDKNTVYEKDGVFRKWNGSFWEEY